MIWHRPLVEFCLGTGALKTEISLFTRQPPILSQPFALTHAHLAWYNKSVIPPSFVQLMQLREADNLENLSSPLNLPVFVSMSNRRGQTPCGAAVLGASGFFGQIHLSLWGSDWTTVAEGLSYSWKEYFFCLCNTLRSQQWHVPAVMREEGSLMVR